MAVDFWAKTSDNAAHFAVMRFTVKAPSQGPFTPKPETLMERTANPAPLGLMGIGMTTVLLNIHNAGFYPLRFG